MGASLSFGRKKKEIFVKSEPLQFPYLERRMRVTDTEMGGEDKNEMQPQFLNEISLL